MPAKAVTFSVRLPDEVSSQVDEIARATKRSHAVIIEEAVALYVRDRAVYARELDASVKSARSGVGHSAEQVFEWMDSWAAGDKRPLPAPDVIPQK